MITIRKLPASRWEEYKAFRLETLKADSIAFGSSYEESKTYKDEIWKGRIKNCLFALDNQKIVGMIVIGFEEGKKNKHIANIYGFYVTRDYRGRGIGRNLLKNALLLIRKKRNVIKIKLSVNSKQKAAIQLYKRNGFVTIGKAKRELKIGNRFYDELLMEKHYVT